MWLLFTYLGNYIYELWASWWKTHINFLYIFGEVHIVPIVMEKCILKCIYMQCRMLCFIAADVFITEWILCRNSSFHQCNRFGFITIVVITSAIHIIGYSICHSCNTINYVTMWLFHLHNDNNISHITGVTISSATMATS